jgi:hypothetical protein
LFGGIWEFISRWSSSYSCLIIKGISICDETTSLSVFLLNARIESFPPTRKGALDPKIEDIHNVGKEIFLIKAMVDRGSVGQGSSHVRTMNYTSIYKLINKRLKTDHSGDRFRLPLSK